MKQEPAEVILQNQQGTVGILALYEGGEDVKLLKLFCIGCLVAFFLGSALRPLRQS